MAKMKIKGDWLHYREDTVPAANGAVHIPSIVSIDMLSGSNGPTIYTSGNTAHYIENVTIDEILDLIGAGTGHDNVQVIARQAARIEELEQQLNDIKGESP